MKKMKNSKLIIIFALLLVLVLSFYGCSKNKTDDSDESGVEESVLSQDAETESESSLQDENEEVAAEPDADQLQLMKTFARAFYGSESVRNIAYVNESEHDGTTYSVYRFTNIIGDEITVHLADDVAVTKDMYIVDYIGEDGTEILRKVYFDEEVWLGESVTGTEYTDAEYAEFASELAENFAEEKDERVSVEYIGNKIIHNRELRIYLVSDGTRIAFDDKMNNSCRSESEEDDTFIGILEEEDGSYILNPEEVDEDTEIGEA